MSKLPPWVALIWPSAQTIFLFRLLEGCRIREALSCRKKKSEIANATTLTSSTLSEMTKAQILITIGISQYRRRVIVFAAIPFPMLLSRKSEDIHWLIKHFIAQNRVE
jgi:hypothetical protein